MKKNKAAKAATEMDALESRTSNVVEAKGTQVSRQLNDAEAKRLAACETVIKKGIAAFKEVAEALLEINEKQLYKAEFNTFEEYCRLKWEFTDRHAHRLMLAGEVVKNLETDQLVSSIPAAIPVNEAQARPLEGLTREQQVRAARKVAEKTTNPTAKDYEEAVGEVTGVVKTVKRNSKTLEAKPEPDVEEEQARVKSYDIREVEPASQSKVEIDVDLVPMTKIIETLKQISYIYNNSGKKQEGLKLIDKVERWLGDWATWEIKQKEVV
jgi:hypothetical protein